MELNSSGSTILYLYMETNSPQKKFLSVINLDTMVQVLRFRVPGIELKNPKDPQILKTVSRPIM